MELLNKLIAEVANLPELVVLIVCPAILVVVGLLLAVLRAKKAYPAVAIGLGGAGIFLVVCKSGGTFDQTMAWAGLYLVLCALVCLFFLIPFGRGKNVQGDRDQEIYEKFRMELEPTAFPEEAPVSEGEAVSAEEGGLRLQHVDEMLSKLFAADLEASDRLEADAIARSLDVYRNKALNGEELRSLNDSLASVLRLTAKYSL